MKKELIEKMEEEGWKYKGENEWYIMFDWVENEESVLSKDWIKSTGGFAVYDPRQKVNIRVTKKV